MKWAIVNSLPFVSLEDPSLKVCAPIFSFPSLHPILGFFCIKYCFCYVVGPLELGDSVGQDS